MKGHELKLDKGHYIPEIKAMVIYCSRQKQNHKKCKKCAIHLFHNRAAIPLYCFPVERCPSEIKEFEEKVEKEEKPTQQMVIHYKPEVKNHK